MGVMRPSKHVQSIFKSLPAQISSYLLCRLWKSRLSLYVYAGIRAAFAHGGIHPMRPLVKDGSNVGATLIERGSNVVQPKGVILFSRAAAPPTPTKSRHINFLSGFPFRKSP